MDNFGIRNFDGAKPDIINQNGTNLTFLNIGVNFDRYLTGNDDMT